jgi:hypothetical protein
VVEKQRAKRDKQTKNKVDDNGDDTTTANTGGSISLLLCQTKISLQFYSNQL